MVNKAKMNKLLPKAKPLSKRNTNQPFSIGKTNLVLPNHSGDIVKGYSSKTPVEDFDIANKKYVDDSISVEALWDRIGTNTYLKNSGDNVGIGTSSPGQLLEVKSTGAYGAIKMTSGSNPAYHFYTTNANANARNWAISASAYVHGDFAITQSTTKGGSPVGGNYRFYINNAGNVGIGTNSPVRNLHIGNGDNSAILIQGGTTVGDTSELLFKASDTDFDNLFIKGGIFFERASNSGVGDMKFAINNVADSSNVVVSDAVMTLKAGGNVGIGTTSPSAKLDINSDKIILQNAKTPSSASDTGTTGTICWDASYIYVCTATNTWKRTAIATW